MARSASLRRGPLAVLAGSAAVVAVALTAPASSAVIFFNAPPRTYTGTVRYVHEWRFAGPQQGDLDEGKTEFTAEATFSFSSRSSHITSYTGAKGSIAWSMTRRCSSSPLYSWWNQKACSGNGAGGGAIDDPNGHLDVSRDSGGLSVSFSFGPKEPSGQYVEKSWNQVTGDSQVVKDEPMLFRASGQGRASGSEDDLSGSKSENLSTGGTDAITTTWHFTGQGKARFTAAEKQELKDAADVYGHAAAYAGVVAAGIGAYSVAVPPAAGLAAAVGIGASVDGVIALLASDFANDPIDHHFARVARARIARLPAVRPGKGISKAAASALNKLVASEARLVGSQQAMSTAINRAQGAARSGKKGAERKQMLAAARYAQQAAIALDAAARLSPQAYKALLKSHAPTITVDAAGAANIQSSVRANGLPAQVSSALKSLGGGAAASKAMRDAIVNAQPSQLTGGFPQILIDSKLLSGWRKQARTLRNFARWARAHPNSER